MQARLERMRAVIVKRGAGKIGSGGNRVIVNLTGDEKVLSNAEPAAEKFLSTIPNAEPPAIQSANVIKDVLASEGNVKQLLVPAENEGFVVPSQVIISPIVLKASLR